MFKLSGAVCKSTWRYLHSFCFLPLFHAFLLISSAIATNDHHPLKSRSMYQNAAFCVESLTSHSNSMYASISICQTRNFEMIGKLYLSGQLAFWDVVVRRLEGLFRNIPHWSWRNYCSTQSLYLLGTTTEKWSLLLLSTNSVSFLKLAYAKNIRSGVACSVIWAAIIVSMRNTKT